MHPNTQKAVNKWARQYLALYRNSRAYDDPATARWRSHFAMCINASGNVYHIIEARISHNTRAYWKKPSLKSTLEAALDGKATRQDVIAAIDAELAADPEPFDMVEGEGAGQYTFDTPKDSQLAMF